MAAQLPMGEAPAPSAGGRRSVLFPLSQGSWMELRC